MSVDLTLIFKIFWVIALSMDFVSIHVYYMDFTSLTYLFWNVFRLEVLIGE